MAGDLYLGLMHFPVLSKNGQTITTSVTNLDVHDIARTCKTYGISKYFVITPIPEQWTLIERILGHWKEDASNLYNPDRSNALGLVELQKSLETALARIEELSGSHARLCVTGANLKGELISSNDLKQKMHLDNRPILLLFGTGWGLAPSVLEKADESLIPLTGPEIEGVSYNHLSVRSAVAIYCDRLRGN